MNATGSKSFIFAPMLVAIFLFSCAHGDPISTRIEDDLSPFRFGSSFYEMEQHSVLCVPRESNRDLIQIVPFKKAEKGIGYYAKVPWRQGYIAAVDAGEFGAGITFDDGSKRISRQLMGTNVSAIQPVGGGDVILGGYIPMISSPNSSVFIVSGNDWPPRAHAIYRSAEDTLRATYYARDEIILKTDKYLFWISRDGKVLSRCER
jgi:hypothetical protein